MPVIGQVAGEAPVLVPDFLDDDMRVFGFPPEMADMRVGDLLDDHPLLFDRVMLERN